MDDGRRPTDDDDVDDDDDDDNDDGDHEHGRTRSQGLKECRNHNDEEQERNQVNKECKK